MERDAFNHLCGLARLTLGAGEFAEFEGKFARLLGFVEQVQGYTPQTSGPPLTLIDRVELRRDMPLSYDWPENTAHSYRVPAVIDFEGGG
jgi:Asp-tRNA(Asn)/Glu-tRNA(Gln) amidotransferase C subunit